MYIVLIFGAVITISAAVDPCPYVLSVDITSGDVLKNGTIVHDGITYPHATHFNYKGEIRGCICSIRNCIRKCCPSGQALIEKNCTSHGDDLSVKVYSETTPANVSANHFYFLYNNRCDENGFYRLSVAEYPEDEFYIQENGKMFRPAAVDHTINPELFCVENFVDEQTSTVSALVCFGEERARKVIYSIGMIISMPFLLVTFIVYAILPDRNLHGKALMCYVIALLGAYLLLVFIQLNPDTLEMVPCQTIGIVCLFFFMVSFFWMNVMSIDIWWAFSGLRGFSGSKTEAERKRFLLYCAYAWGVPLLLVTLVILLTLSPRIPPYAWYNPGMGFGQCWLREGVPTLVYFYGPMALLIISNVTLFAVTAWKIKSVKRDTAMLRKDESKKHTYENDKQRFNLYLKLMLAMGVNWSMEIISWLIDWQVGSIPPAVWYVTDFCNALYGVFIFFIFVFKRNIWKLLKRRYYTLLGKPHLARTMTQNTYSPRTTTISQTSNTEKTFVNDSSVLTSEVA